MREFNASARRQRGLTLVIAMVMLVILTLFGVAMIKLGANSLEVVNNMQAQKATEAAAQVVLENTVSSMKAFKDAVTLNASGGTIVCGKNAAGTDVNWTLTSGKWVCNTAANSYTVMVWLPECIYFEPAPGYALDETPGYVPPEDTNWDIKAVATDSLSGAESEVHQGVRIRRTKGNCP